MFIQEIDRGVQKPGSELVVCLPVEVVDIAGCDKGPGIVTGDQFPEFIKGDVGIVGGVGGEQWTWQALAGPQGVVQIEVFFPSFVEKGEPFAGLPCVDVDTVVGVKIAVCLVSGGQVA